MGDLTDLQVILFAVGTMSAAVVISLAGWELAYLITRALRRHK